ncbi:hypothetical protein MUN84_18480 [Hymenobacter sp. 5516J-16]|uniref:hypothetical protein n=1 Tax=Hymenobacter sp. 5516J-16 TaxID=2932253 RepID=UPI001FD07DF7|nr:hypothetical protein [Hymenobacter sp. 5516J-16]UOQ76506.1 hypothetical protein MUN84_18480 [Hymenobacter sp. 5516J-16]
MASTEKKTLYTADATAIGGRSGHVRSATGIIDLDMSVPEGLGARRALPTPRSCSLRAILPASSKRCSLLPSAAATSLIRKPR